MTINSKFLYSLLAIAFKMVQSRPVIPVLASVLVKFSKDSVSITGCSGNAYVTITEKGEFTPLEFCIERTILDYLATVPDQPIMLKMDGRKLIISTATGKAKFDTDPATDFNVVPVPCETEMAINAQDLKDGVEMVGHLRTTKEDSFGTSVTNCIYIGELDGRTMMQAFDMALNAGAAAAINQKLVQPLLIMPKSLSIVNEMTGDVEISQDDRFMHMKCGNLTVSEVKVTSKWGDNIGRALTMKQTASCVVSGTSLKMAIKRLRSTVPSHVVDNSITFSVGNSKMKLSIGDAVEYMDVTGDDIPETTINYHALLSFCHLGEMTIGINGNLFLVSTEDFLGVSATMVKHA